MQRKPAYDKVLFIILMALLFMPMLQGRFRLIDDPDAQIVLPTSIKPAP